MHAHPTRTLLILLAVLILGVVIVYALLLNFSSQQSVQQTPTVATFPKDAPTPKPQDYVTAQKGFQYLVQYTSTGFHPSSLTVKKGQTVRFTNNSNVTLQLSLPNTTPLTHAQYIEYTFTKSTTVSGGANTIQVTVN